MGFPPPSDSQGNPVGFTSGESDADDDSTPGMYTDAPSEGMPCDSTITVFSLGLDVTFETPDAMCKPWLVAVVLFHEYQHAPGGGYPGFGGDACGEWQAMLATLEFICEAVATLAALPSGPGTADMCAAACQAIVGFEIDQAAAIAANCTGFSTAIPSVCVGCDCY